MVDVSTLMKKLQSRVGRIVVSIILGLGIATLFKPKCHKRDCLEFNGPDLDEIKDNVYRYNNKCYKFKLTSKSCVKNSEHQVNFS